MIEFAQEHAWRRLLLGAGLVVVSCATHAAQVVGDVRITDVTTRAFSVVWMADEPIDPATTTVEVFTDDAATTPRDPAPTILKLDSGEDEGGNVASDDLGIVKFDVQGLDFGEVVHVRVTTNGMVDAQTTPVTMALRTTKVNDSDPNNPVPIVNDVLLHNVFVPTGLGVADGMLLMFEVQDEFGLAISDYPLTAFVGQGNILDPTAGFVDFNNLFASGESLQTLAGQTVKITMFRGMTCDLPPTTQLVQLRRVPEMDEPGIPAPGITQLLPAADCFAPDGVVGDLDCDGTISSVDITRFRTSFELTDSSCAFNPQLDLNESGDVDTVDITRVRSLFEVVEQ